MARSIYGIGQRDKGSGVEDEAQAKRWHDDVPKEIAWRVELQESLACWYDLVFNPPVQPEPKQTVLEALGVLQGKVLNAPVDRAGQAGLCLIGFWATRTKVRFCMRKSPYFALMGDEFVFYVELGAGRVRKKLSTTFVDVHSGGPVKPQIELDERFITIKLPEEEPETVSVYDFLRKCGLELDISTDIYAVSHINVAQLQWHDSYDHRLAQMLYQVSNEECDFFFFCNLFKVTAVSLDSQGGAGVDALRPVWPSVRDVDSVDGDRVFYSEGYGGAYRYTQDERGHLIEQALKTYFQLPKLVLSAQGDSDLSIVNGQVFSIQILMDMDNSHELYRFGSFEIEAADKHMFTCRIVDDNAELVVLE